MKDTSCYKCKALGASYFGDEDGTPGAGWLCYSCHQKLRNAVWEFVENWIEPKVVPDPDAFSKTCKTCGKGLSSDKNDVCAECLSKITSSDTGDDCSGHNCDCYNFPY